MGAQPTGAEPNDGGIVYEVVVNDEEQYSIWPAGRPAPAGWAEAGFSGTEAECVEYVDRVWTDLRPRSLRAALGETDA